MKKNSVPQDLTTISAVYAANNKASECTMQKLVAPQREINPQLQLETPTPLS